MSNIIKIAADGSQLPTEATDHAAVHHVNEGIIFAVNAPGFEGEMTYDEAVAKLAELNHAGAMGWVLAPTLRDQLLNVDYSRCSPAADPCLYPDTKLGRHWTGQACAWSKDSKGVPGAFWQVYGYSGLVYGDGRYDGAFVRPCRVVARPGQ